MPTEDGPPVDVTPLIRQVNASSDAVEDLYLRARQEVDIARRSSQDAEQATELAAAAKVTHRTIQAENPRRRAPLAGSEATLWLPSPWTESPATSPPRPWTGARTPRWCGRSCSWPS